jgi:hypothetical protein
MHVRLDRTPRGGAGVQSARSWSPNLSDSLNKRIDIGHVLKHLIGQHDVKRSDIVERQAVILNGPQSVRTVSAGFQELRALGDVLDVSTVRVPSLREQPRYPVSTTAPNI